MPVKVIIPTPLRQYADKKESLEVQAKTVAEALAAVTSQYGDLRKHLYNDEGKLRASSTSTWAMRYSLHAKRSNSPE